MGSAASVRVEWSVPGRARADESSSDEMGSSSLSSTDQALMDELNAILVEEEDVWAFEQSLVAGVLLPVRLEGEWWW